MIKALAAMAIAAFVAAGLTLLPGFAPQVQASVQQPLGRSDRLDFRPIGRDCSQHAWPNFEAACLRFTTGNRPVPPARVVTLQRAR
ncbi:MAG: hypothetical protein ACREDC_03945 [Bradyrhizobium sp.]